MTPRPWFAAALCLAFASPALHAQPSAVLSHPPLRPLPELTKRPMTKGPAFFVDPKNGEDAGPGGERAPWRTINHALKQLGAGDTLYLRGGVYRENVYCAAAGTKDAPITVRAYPGERVVIDG